MTAGDLRNPERASHRLDRKRMLPDAAVGAPAPLRIDAYRVVATFDVLDRANGIEVLPSEG